MSKKLIKSAAGFAIGVACGALLTSPFSLTQSIVDSLFNDPNLPLSAGAPPRSEPIRRGSPIEPRRVGAASIPIMQDPREVLRETLAHDVTTQSAVLRKLAFEWVRYDPEAALAEARRLPEAAKVIFQSAVAREWAFVNPDGFFAYAEAASAIDELIAGLTLLIATDPDRVRRIASRAQGPRTASVQDLELEAIRGMVYRDPTGATARLAAIPTSDPTPILSAAMEAYADLDPEGALRWLLAENITTRRVQMALVTTVARDDLIRAYDMVDEIGVEGLGTGLEGSAFRGKQSPVSVANALAYSGAHARRLDAFVQSWFYNDHESALSWMVANARSVDAGRASLLARYLVTKDLELAKKSVDRVPPEIRAAWIEGIALSYALSDPENAARWVEQFQGQPGYDEAYEQVISGMANSRPSFAAQLLEDARFIPDDGTVATVASEWTSRDPTSALEWALALERETMASTALVAVTSTWIDANKTEALQSILRLTPGLTRDRVLGSSMQSLGLEEQDFARLIAGFSSSLEAQQNIVAAIERRSSASLSTRGKQVSEFLLERLTDPTLRRRAEAAISGP